MNIDALKVELLAGHPGTGAYNADHALATEELNAANRTRNIPTLTSSQVYNAVDGAEYVALSAEAKAEVWNILHMGEINPFGREGARFVAIFGGGSATITTLAAARLESVSRAVEIGLGFVRVGHVEEARR